MFKYEKYTVVGTADQFIHVDENNVYMPQALIDNPDLVGTFECLWNLSFDRQMQKLISDFWSSNLLHQFGSTLVTPKEEVMFDRVVQGHLPSYVLEWFQVRKTEKYCYVTSSRNPGFQFYGVFDEKSEMYLPYFEADLKPKIMSAINSSMKTQSETDLVSSITFLRSSGKGWILTRGVLSIDMYSHALAMTSFVEVNHKNTRKAVLHIPHLEISQNRVKYNALSYTPDQIWDCDDHGAKVLKGEWKATKDKGNNMNLPEEFYITKLYKFCQDQTTDTLMGAALVVDRVSDDIFLIGNVMDEYDMDRMSILLTESIFVKVHPTERPKFLAHIENKKVHFEDGTTEDEKQTVDIHLLAFKLQSQ